MWSEHDQAICEKSISEKSSDARKKQSDIRKGVQYDKRSPVRPYQKRGQTSEKKLALRYQNRNATSTSKSTRGLISEKTAHRRIRHPMTSAGDPKQLVRRTLRRNDEVDIFVES